jgi:hypothetical protein
MDFNMELFKSQLQQKKEYNENSWFNILIAEDVFRL